MYAMRRHLTGEVYSIVRNFPLIYNHQIGILLTCENKTKWRYMGRVPIIMSSASSY